MELLEGRNPVEGISPDPLWELSGGTMSAILTEILLLATWWSGRLFRNILDFHGTVRCVPSPKRNPITF